MKILIVVPPITEDETQWYLFPIGIAYVTAALKSAKFDVKTLNLNYKKNPMEVLSKFIIDEKIDVLGVGGLSTQYPELKEIVAAAKKANPNIVTMVGGGIISGDAPTAMEALGADYGMIGEGEETICELARYLENPSLLDRKNIDGIIYKEIDCGTQSGYYTTSPRKEIMELDSIPFPDYDGFEYEKVMVNDSSTYIFSEGSLNTAAICGSRSCVYNCTFCFHSSGKKYRERSVDNIFKEIDILLEKYPVEQLFIVDELFAANKARLDEFCNRIKSYNLAWIASLRVDVVTQEIVQKLKEANCSSIAFGLESADNRILKSMRKNITIEQIENALEICNKVGLLYQGGFIFGDLEETVETYTNTINWWKSHRQYYVKLALITTYPGSYLYKIACERGIIKDRVQFLKDGCQTINVSKLTQREYGEMAEIIDNIMSITENVKLENVEYTIENKKINIKADCPSCKCKQSWEQMDAFRRVETICRNCNSKYQLDIYKNIDLKPCEENIREILAKYGKIAIWPRTVSTYNLIEAIRELKADNVYIVDKSPLKQQSRVNGKKTYPPKVIIDEDIPCVIINIPTNVEGEIEREILRNYKNVKRIFKAGELLEKIDI